MFVYIARMKRYYLNFIFTSLIFSSAILTFFGCSGTKHAEGSSSVHQIADERKKDIALQHFIAGSALEAKDDYANAIIEYQDALRYDYNATILYTIAKNYLALDKPSLAAQYARAAVDAEPTNIHFREKLAEVFIETFQNDSAIVQFEQIISLDPTSTQNLFTLARLYSLKKPLEAINTYNKLRDQIGDDWDVLFRLSELYAQLGKTDSTISIMESMLQHDPGNTTLRSALAELYMQTKNIDRARKLYEDLAERDPIDVRYTIALAEIERREGNWEKAVEMFNKILRNDSLRIEGKMQIAEAFLQSVATDSSMRPHALKIFTQLRDEYPKDWRPYWYLGAYHFNMREYTTAIDAFEEILAIDSTNVQAYDLLARTYLNLEDYEHALARLEQAVRLKDDNPELLSLLGFVYSRVGDKEKTISCLEKALKINPKQMDALSTLALTLDGMKRFSYSDSLYEAAIKLYESGLPKEPTYYLLLNNYAYSLSERDMQLEHALEISKQAVDQEKENSSYLDTIGWIYFKLNNFPEALKYISQAVDIRTNKEKQPGPALYEHLGDVYYKMGDKVNAIKNWTKALEQDSSNPSLREKVARGSL